MFIELATKTVLGNVNKVIIASGIILIIIGSPFLYWGLRIQFSSGDFRGVFLLGGFGVSMVILGLMLIVQDLLKKGLCTIGIAILSSSLFLLFIWMTQRPSLLQQPSGPLTIAEVSLFAIAGAALIIIGIASKRREEKAKV